MRTGVMCPQDILPVNIQIQARVFAGYIHCSLISCLGYLPVKYICLLSASLPICLSVSPCLSLSRYLIVCLLVYLSVYQSVPCLSICQFVSASLSLSVYFYVAHYLYLYLYILLYLYLPLSSVSLFTSLYICLHYWLSVCISEINTFTCI